MNVAGFTNNDFDVFTIDGLEPRMDALKSQIRPKLESLGDHFASDLSVLTGNEMFYHVAKHARRTVNPPNDTWVAFAPDKRGYKKHPHFQIGLWESHVFIWFAVIYEAPNKNQIGSSLERNVQKLRQSIPRDFVWSDDHTKPGAVKMSDLTDNELLHFFERLQTVKKAEILCGYHIPREEAVHLTGEELVNKVNEVFVKLVPLYELI
ncbi:uncharacterized protein YktB (UPF0637 family) [Bacillus ectoiniformans]|uniref:YktB family protein n=1 Tax=Bacillus ectoiniformans TaxID=1494429 RepID=UPI00195CAFFA|nr:DUF1054 domain-containing protein [Bacillus ectoiniformans]MBM7647273.1 uncharacterized protein YktB (UPF0637 family) [Bacillus ectoiniformans]